MSNPTTMLNEVNHEKEKDHYNALTPIQAFIFAFFYNKEFQENMQASSEDLKERKRRNDIARQNSEQSAKKYFIN